MALKVLRSLPGEKARARFEHEGELLARLDHPSIASIHATGTARVGGMTVPFFAMELVRGRPLDVFAREEALGRRERVALLARIADAVHHAHQKGVVHRDLKPSNVLVDERGDPRVLDFGIARTVDPDLELESLRTEAGQLLGTVPYMSPEQAAGRPEEIDSRSDVYSLGVLAYELLGGRLPVDVNGLPVLEALRAVRDDEPPRLGALDRSLRGDLETIVGVALAKERERRYGSAHELAADLRRFLEDQPIAARPATASYQLRKFARRHRALVAGALGTVAALVLGLAGTLYGLAEAGAERDDAERRFRQADALLEFQERMYQTADPGGEGVRVAELLARSKRLVEGFTKDPVERAAIHLTLGKAYRGVGLYGEAEPLFASAVSDFERELGADDLQSLSARTEWARLLGQPMGRPREAEEVLEGVVARAAEAHGPAHESTLAARIVEAQLHYELARPREGLELARDVERLAEPGSSAWIAARRWHSNFLKDLGDVEGSLAIAREDLRWHVEAFGPEDPRTLSAMNTLGTALYSEGRSMEAKPILDDLYECRMKQLGAEHPATIDSKIKVAACLYYAGESDRAKDLLLEVLDTCDRVFRPDHPTRLFALNSLAACYNDLGRPAEAEVIHREVVERTSDLRGPEHRNTLVAMMNLAVSLNRLGRVEETEELYAAVLELSRKTLGDRHVATLSACAELGSFYSYYERYEEAEALLREAAETGRDALGPDHDRSPYFLRLLGEVLVYRGKFDEAEELLLESRPWTERTHPADHPERTKILWSLEFLYREWGREEEAAVYRALAKERDT